MRKAGLLFLTVLLATIAGRAQDIITFTNGTQVQAKVLEINPDNVRYKDYDNPNGPVITVLKFSVASIQYPNGKKTVINDASPGGKLPSEQYMSNNAGMTEPDSARRRQPDGLWSPEPEGPPRHRYTNARLEGWYFGAEASYGSAHITSNDQNYSVQGGNLAALNLCTTYMFNEHFGIQFGLGVETYSYGITYYYEPNDKFTINYYTIPVRALYCSNTQKKAGFYAMAGLDIALLSHAEDNEHEVLTNYYSSQLASLYAGCGIDIRSKRSRAFWMVGPYVRTSLVNAYSGSGAYTSYLDLNPGNNGTLYSAGLSLVYMFKFNGMR